MTARGECECAVLSFSTLTPSDVSEGRFHPSGLAGKRVRGSYFFPYKLMETRQSAIRVNIAYIPLRSSGKWGTRFKARDGLKIVQVYPIQGESGDAKTGRKTGEIEIVTPYAILR